MARFYHPHDTLPDWDGYGGYLDLLDREPPSVNIGVLVGHGNLRLETVGGDPRAPDPGELEGMRAILREGLDAGALGFSSGLIYEPSRYAELGELVALAEVMAPVGGIYATDMRNEADHLLEAVEEAIAVGERGGVPVQISHHKAAGENNWGRVRESLAMIDEARARGVDVRVDQYPYTASSTILAAIVGGRTLEPGGRTGLGAVTGDRVVVASAPGHPGWEGRPIAAFAEEWGCADQAAAERGPRRGAPRHRRGAQPR
ncbi:MAG: hypothetical protein U5R31_01955 [Acidimicrobiia bacterium]|nr:hypothetical protein [Acidimicrobiia bacterium]